MSNVVQRSFAGGELAPSCYARTDQLKYATGLRTCRNFIVQRHGGVANRPGTLLVAPVKDVTKTVRLIKFAFNDDQTYLLEFGDRYLRVARAGGQIVTSGVLAWVTATAYALAALVTNGGVTYYCTAAHTSGATTEPGVGASWASNWYAQTGVIYEIPTPYVVADLATLQCVQSADIVTIVHPNYAPRELRRTGHTSWTLALKAFQPAIGGVLNPALTDGAGGVITYWAITAIDAATGEEGLPVFVSAINRIPSSGTPTTVNWDKLGGALGYNVYRSTDGVTYGFLGPSAGTPQLTIDTAWTTTSSSVSTSSPTLVAAANQARNPVVATVAQKAYNEAYMVAGTLTVSAAFGSPGSTAGLVRAYYSRDSEPRVDAGIVDVANIYGATSLTRAFSGTVTVPDNGYATLTLDFVCEVAGSSLGGPASTYTCSIDLTSSPNDRVTWQATSTGYIDTGLTPDYSVGPPVEQTLFQSEGGYPAAVTYYQQRQLLASTTAEPERVWGSRSGVFSSFTKSTPLQDDDMVSFALASREVNAIRHMLDVGRLLILTAAGEWVLGESETDVLTPSNINVRQRLYYGVSTVPPVVVGNVVLFLQARGAVLRDLMTDVVQGYKTNDLTIFAAHLVDGFTIVDMAFAQTPHMTLWAVRSDGVLLGLSYIREQEIWGWHRHDTDGAVENVCVLPEGTEDAVYLVVRRTINGTTQRYIERMASRAITPLTDVRDLHFVDCGLVYDGRNTGTRTMTLSGGVAWDSSETIPCTASTAFFSAADVGSRIDFTAADGSTIRFAIEGYTSTTVVTGRVNRLTPADLRAVATLLWAKAAHSFSGLSHLEAKALAVFADGVVVASPNNDAYPVVTVASGAFTLPEPYVVVRAGLPYISDLETLDIDTPQGPSLKEKGRTVKQVGLMVQSSRGIFAGFRVPTGDDPLEGLLEYKAREGEDYDSPTALKTDYIEIGIDSNWQSNGRVAIRQVDPLPLTILSVSPQGNLALS